MAVGVAAPKGLGRSLTIALHQIAYGLVLIGDFSLGLASVLTSSAVYGQQWLEKSPLGTGIIQRLSVVSALAFGLIHYGINTRLAP